MGEEACRCTAADLARHQRRLSGPLLDRIDVLIPVARPSASALRDECAPPSATVRARVIEARERQAQRLAAFGIACNAQMTPRVMREVAQPTPSALRAALRAPRPPPPQRPRPHPRPPRRPHGRRPRGRRPHRSRPRPHRRRAAPRTAGAAPPYDRCDDCLRRTDLVAALAGWLDVEWRKRDAPTRVLARTDEQLLDACDMPDVRQAVRRVRSRRPPARRSLRHG